MKLKYYLRGMGLGIIFATIVMTVSIKVHNNYLSEEKIIEEATKLGMIMPKEESTENHTLSSEGESQGQDSQIENSQQESQIETESDSEQKPSSESQQEEGTEIVLTQDTYQSSHGGEVIIRKSPNNPTREIVMTIKKGATSEDVAEVLYQCGYIESVESFNEYMSSHNYNRVVRTGEKIIKAGSTYQEIAQILLTKYENEN